MSKRNQYAQQEHVRSWWLRNKHPDLRTKAGMRSPKTCREMRRAVRQQRDAA